MHLVGFIIGIYHDARSRERQKTQKGKTLNRQNKNGMASGGK